MDREVLFPNFWVLKVIESLISLMIIGSGNYFARWTCYTNQVSQLLKLKYDVMFSFKINLFNSNDKFLTNLTV